MPPVDIAELERLARAAKSWTEADLYEETCAQCRKDGSTEWSISGLAGGYHDQFGDEHQARFVAAAHPQAILRLCEAVREMRAVVDEQANDDGIWFIAQTGPEAYLQQELRRLHALIEGVTPDDCARSLLARAGEEK